MHAAQHAIARFWRKAFEDNVTGLAAMVAYTLLLSVFPLALIVLFVAGRVLESETTEASVLADLQQLFPSVAESTLRDSVRGLRDASTTTGILAFASAIWLGTSFWGALDTAFCRIYGLECRSWLRQKVFALGMLVVVLLFVLATVAVPTFQALLLAGAEDLPFGLAEVRGIVVAVSLAAGLLVLFTAMCALYWKVPKGTIPWSCVWPGALVATGLMALVDYGFPLYLKNISSLRVGTSLLLAAVVLIWFYVLALILLVGAVVNELRFEGHRSRAPEPASAAARRAPEPSPALRAEQ